jgi:hypothetical protein
MMDVVALAVPWAIQQLHVVHVQDHCRVEELKSSMLQSKSPEREMFPLKKYHMRQ